MECPNCGHEMALDQESCQNCGTRTSPAEPAASSPAAPAKSNRTPVVIIAVVVVLALIACLCLAACGLIGICTLPYLQTAQAVPTRAVVRQTVMLPTRSSQAKATQAPVRTVAPRETISIWYTWTTGEDAVLNDLASKYMQEHPNVRIELVQIPSTEFKERLQVVTAAGQSPTIVMAYHDLFDNSMKATMFRPLGDLAPVELVAQINPQSVDAVTSDGQMYAVPLFNTCVTLYYNKELLGDREPPQTVQEMVVLAKEVAPQKGYGLAWNSLFFWSAGYLWGFGGQLFDADAKCVLDQGSGAVDFLTWMKGLQDAEGVKLDNNISSQSDLFRAGKAAMINDGSWMLLDYQKSLGADKVGVALLPAASQPATSLLAVEGAYISASTSDSQAAAAMSFIAYLAAPEQIQLFVEKSGRVPANLAVDISANPGLSGLMEQTKNAIPVPTVPEMAAVWGA
ncbi:MAG: extracellular solute-binding protein, partial [Chloroflexi bacterium]|nr:extracellular solute-binding protein [Chloroflexota bacterium]